MNHFFTCRHSLKYALVLIVFLLFTRASCSKSDEEEVYPENTLEGKWKIAASSISPARSNGETDLWKKQDPEFDEIRFETLIDFRKNGDIKFVPANYMEDPAAHGYMDIVRDAGPGFDFFCNPDKDYDNFYPKWEMKGDSIQICSRRYHVELVGKEMIWVYSYSSLKQVYPQIYEKKTITTRFARP